MEGIVIPPPFSNLNTFSSLILVKIMRPELFQSKILAFIEQELGVYFTNNINLSIEDSFNDSSIVNPLIYVLQPGDDP